MVDSRILYLIGASELGGTEKMLVLLASRVQAAGFDPLIVGLKGEGSFSSAVQEHRLPGRFLDLARNPGSIGTLIRILKKEKPLILHSFLYAANILGRLLGKLTGIPVVISSQRSTDEWRKPYHWQLDFRTQKLAHVIVSNSQAGKEVLIRKGRIRPDKITVIVNGIELPGPVIPADRSRFGPGYLVGTVGNLRPAKGHRYLIQAAPLILSRFPGTKFLIVGQGPLQPGLEQMVSEAGLEDNFIFPGFLTRPEQVVQILDVFVLPSLWEGCPVSLLEAMALGKPCVSSAVGDVPAIITHGVDGLVVPPGQPQALAEAVVGLLADPARRQEMGSQARRTILARYSWEKMVAAYVSLYRKLLNANLQPADLTVK